MKTTRGLRNNNPFNIRHSGSKWKGLCKKQTDKDFCQFETLEYGLRAGLMLLRNYIRKGYDTPVKIINRFAPKSENDTDSYLLYVCRYAHVSADYRLAVASPTFFDVASAILVYESACSKDYYELLKIYIDFKL